MKLMNKEIFFCLAVTYLDGLFVQGLYFQQDITKTNVSTPEMTFGAPSHRCLRSSHNKGHNIDNKIGPRTNDEPS